jgi:hypothetical protein
VRCSRFEIYSILNALSTFSLKVFIEEFIDIREIRDFAMRAQFDFGYNIDVSIMDTMYL